MASEDSQSSGGRKTITSATTTTTPLRPPEQGLKCPRCDSPNTKFCYYNNYSLTQPRHFCKTCRRYWTKGGALRNVPVGGGCRKAKKTKSSSGASSSSSRLPSDFSDTVTEPGPGLRFFNGLAPASADFQLGVLPFSRSFNNNNNNNNNQLISFGEFSSAGASASSYPFPSTVGAGVYGHETNITPSSIASSIESLSSINQDLHWKLQQQRLAMLFGGETHKDQTTAHVPNSLPTPLLDNSQPEPLTPNFQVPGNSKSWFLDSPYINTSNNNNHYNSNSPNNNNNNTNNNSSNNNNNDHNSTVSNWNGMTTWNDMHHQFTTMP